PPLSLHDALPICHSSRRAHLRRLSAAVHRPWSAPPAARLILRCRITPVRSATTVSTWPPTLTLTGAIPRYRAIRKLLSVWRRPWVSQWDTVKTPARSEERRVGKG